MFLSRLKPTLFRVSTKLTLVYSLVLIFSSTVIFSFLYFQISQALRGQEQIILEAKLDEFRNRLEVQGLENFSKHFGSLPQYDHDAALYVSIISARGEPLFMHDPNPYFHVDPELEGDSSVLVVEKTLANGDQLMIAKNTLGLKRQMLNLQKIFWWLLLPVALIGFLGGLFLSNRTLTPVRELLTSMKKIESGSLSTRVPVSGDGDELEELKHLCNKMLDKIEGLVSGLKEAFDHLAHDIRTPVTRLRGRAELALTSEGDFHEALNLAAVWAL
ncbi:MAG: HAMP domain-containing protein, partial [Bdellovibrio sp.]